MPTSVTYFVGGAQKGIPPAGPWAASFFGSFASTTYGTSFGEILEFKTPAS